MHKKIQIGAGIVLTAAVIAVFYFSFFYGKSPKAGQPTTKGPAVVSAPAAYHPLSGKPVEKVDPFFTISVLFDNFQGIGGKTGMEEASIFYEALAEGGITRIMALYASTDSVAKFGPIRSVRSYFLDWASEYGGAVMHVGGSPAALRDIRSRDLVDIDQIGAREIYFERDEALPAPHNVFAADTSWRMFGERLEMEPGEFRSWRYEAMQQPASVPQQQIEVEYWPDNKLGWVYNPADNTYIRFLNGEREYFSSGKPFAVSNLIVIEVPSRIIDDLGRQEMSTLGSGDARVYRNGSETEARWIKETATDRMKFTDLVQEEVKLMPGRTWVQVVPQLDMSTYTVFTP